MTVIYHILTKNARWGIIKLALSRRETVTARQEEATRHLQNKEEQVPQHAICKPFSVKEASGRSRVIQVKPDPKLHELFFRHGFTDIPPPPSLARREPSMYNPVDYRLWQEEEKQKWLAQNALAKPEEGEKKKKRKKS